MANIKDIARLADVSMGTVSNYLNKTRPVSPEKAQRIQAAILQASYQPNAAGRSLRRKRRTDVGVLLPNLEDPHYASVLSGITAFFRDTEYFVDVFTSGDDPEAEAHALSQLLSREPMGLILVPCRKSAQELDVPVVEVDRRSGAGQRGFASFDHKETFRRVARSFLDRGVWRVALLTGPARFTSEREAREGYEQAFFEVGRSDAQLPFLTAMPTKEDAFRVVTDVAAGLRPEVVITTCEPMALGVYEALALLGWDMEQITIVSPGHRFWSRYSGSRFFLPIDRPSFALGRAAAQLLTRLEEAQTVQDRTLRLEDDLSCLEGPKAPLPVRTAEPCSLRVLMMDNPQAEFLEHVLQRFQKETNISVTMVKQPHKDIFDTIVHDRGTREYDAYVYNISWLPNLVNGNVLADLTPHIARTGFDPDIYFPGCLGHYGAYAGKNYGLPFLYTPQILYYRRDLFESPDLQRAFEAEYGARLRPPKTWTEFNQVAAFFTRSCHPNSPTAHGTVVTAAYSACLAPEFYLRLAANGGRVFDDEFQVCFESPQTRKAYLTLLRTMGLDMEEACRANYARAAELYLAGDAAMLITYPTFANHMAAMGKNEQAQNAGYALAPGGMSLLFGWGMGVSRESRHPLEAFQFISWICGEEMASYCALLAVQSPVKSIYQNEEFVRRYPWLPLFSDAYTGARPVPIPHAPNRSAIPRRLIDDVICRHIYRAARQEVTVDTAIADTQRELSAMFEQFGYWQRRR